jgi:chromate reductase
MNPVKIFAISGSLRSGSLNSMLLRAAARLAPPGISVELYRDLGTLPLFNPDLEIADPRPVAALHQRIIGSDAVLIASPEYARGVTGAIKNALDWMVGNESFVDKPVGLLNASPRSNYRTGRAPRNVSHDVRAHCSQRLRYGSCPGI